MTDSQTSSFALTDIAPLGLLTVRQCAEQALVAEQTVRNRIADGSLNAMKCQLTGRGTWLIYTEDWTRFMAAEYPDRAERLKGLASAHGEA